MHGRPGAFRLISSITRTLVLRLLLTEKSQRISIMNTTTIALQKNVLARLGLASVDTFHHLSGKRHAKTTNPAIKSRHRQVCLLAENATAREDHQWSTR